MNNEIFRSWTCASEGITTKEGEGGKGKPWLPLPATLLPSHRPATEKAIDLAAADAFAGIDIKQIDISPETCTPEVLQVLAYSYNVDISGLDLPQARRLVAKAFLLNRHRGTRFAVFEVLNAMFPKATLEELEDEPYLFKIAIPLEQTETLTAATYKSLIKVIDSAKNARSHLKGVDINIDDIKATPVVQEGFKYSFGINQELETLGTSDNIVTNYLLFRI